MWVWVVKVQEAGYLHSASSGSPSPMFRARVKALVACDAWQAAMRVHRKLVAARSASQVGRV